MAGDNTRDNGNKNEDNGSNTADNKSDSSRVGNNNGADNIPDRNNRHFAHPLTCLWNFQ